MTDPEKRDRFIPIRGMLAIETKIVLEHLGKMSPGDTATYETLDQLTKCNVRKRRNVITTATNKLLLEQGKVFVAERAKGIRLLRNEEIPNLGPRDISRVSNLARKCMRRLAAVNFGELPSEGKILHNTSLTILTLFQRGSTAKAVKMIEETVRKQSNPLPLGETLKLFSAT